MEVQGIIVKGIEITYLVQIELLMFFCKLRRLLVPEKGVDKRS